MRKIITTPDPRLREKSTKVREITNETHEIIADMIAASLAWEEEHPYELSVAMAAPQLGVNQRIIVVRDDFEDKENKSFTALINPEIVRAEGKIVKQQEGCLSVPSLYGLVGRKNRVKVKALLEDGSEARIKASGYLARTLIHEIDHLDGILFIDHIKGKRDAFFRMDSDGELYPITDYDNEIANNQQLWGEDD